MFHEKDNKVAPSPEDDNENLNDEQPDVAEVNKKLDNLESELADLKQRLKRAESDDPKAGLFFDAIFNDVEAQQQTENTDTN